MTAAAGAPAAGTITFRSFRDDADYEACWELQGEIWGEQLRDRASPALMRVSQYVGGVAAGAFDPAGVLLGFVWGLSGFRHGRPAHWSHILGVRPGLRDLGLGRRLKLFQRRLLLPRGVEAIWWTFDPLEARNGHLNFNRLGVEVEGYVRDYYGSGAGSLLHRGLGTDRFIVVWRLTSPRAMAALAGRPPEGLAPFAGAPVVGSRLDGAGVPQPLDDAEPPPGPLRIEVPAAVQALKAAEPETAARWRAVTRRLFETCLARGQTVRAFYREPADGRCFYGVS